MKILTTHEELIREAMDNEAQIEVIEKRSSTYMIAKNYYIEEGFPIDTTHRDTIVCSWIDSKDNIQNILFKIEDLEVV